MRFHLANTSKARSCRQGSRHQWAHGIMPRGPASYDIYALASSFVQAAKSEPSEVRHAHQLEHTIIYLPIARSRQHIEDSVRQGPQVLPSGLSRCTFPSTLSLSFLSGYVEKNRLGSGGRSGAVCNLTSLQRRRYPSGFDFRRSRSGPVFEVEAPPHARRRDGFSGKYVGGHWMNKNPPEAALVRCSLGSALPFPNSYRRNKVLVNPKK